MRSFNVTTENKSYKWTCIKLMTEKEKVSHMKDIQSFLLTNEQNRILNEKISGYRKVHSKPTAWLSFRDDIIQAMNRASDISRKKRQNFAGFSGANSRKNRPISRDFRGKKVKIGRTIGQFRAIFAGEESKFAEKPAHFAGFWQKKVKFRRIF